MTSRRRHVALVALAVVAGSAAAPAPTDATAPAQVIVFDEDRIEFEPGSDNATRAGNVDDGNSDRWVLRAAAGQSFELVVDSADDNTAFSVFAPDRTVLTTVVDGTTWSGTLPTGGDHAVEVASTGGAAVYRMKVWIDATARDPLGLVQRLSFASGTDTGSGQGSAVRGSADTWVLAARAGQTMDVTVTSLEGNSTFDVIAPDGTALTAPDARTSWSGRLTSDGDHVVLVQPTRGNATYTLTVRITGGQPPGTVAPPPAPTITRRILFPAGTDRIAVGDTIAAGESHAWLAGADAGQLLSVSVESDLGAVRFDVTDPDGAQAATQQLATQLQLPGDGDYVITVTNAGAVVDDYALAVVIV